uniref:Uncharacterized protein n=1 Tax=Physcomitrium patens TaxID=3218 RepID=A9SR74_PHYPA|nr:hypothetical protein PHYPA_020744 [Physcomitrium patens]
MLEDDDYIVTRCDSPPFTRKSEINRCPVGAAMCADGPSVRDQVATDLRFFTLLWKLSTASISVRIAVIPNLPGRYMHLVVVEAPRSCVCKGKTVRRATAVALALSRPGPPPHPQ